MKKGTGIASAFFPECRTGGHRIVVVSRVLNLAVLHVGLRVTGL